MAHTIENAARIVAEAHSQGRLHSEPGTAGDFQCRGIGDALASDCHGKFVAAVFALCAQMMRHPPHSRMEEQQRFQTALFDVRFGTDKALQQAAAADRSKKK